jgi:hypothetical protein
MMKKLMSLIVLLVLLAACTPSGQQDDADDPTRLLSDGETTRVLTEVTEAAGTPDPALATRGATPTAEATKPGGAGEIPADAAIVFRREGGMEGLMEEWTIYQDGRIVDAAGNEFQVPAAVVEGLVTTAGSSGFFEMDASYMPLDPCCDRFTYWLTVRQGDQVHTVQAIDAEESVPAAFWTIVAAVQSMVEGAATQ